MFFELRQYGAKPGMRDELVKVVEEDVIPYQVSKGMVVVGSCVSLEDEAGYVWIRRFEGDEDKARLYKAVYESDHWKQVIAPKVGASLDREAIKVTRIAPTSISVVY